MKKTENKKFNIDICIKCKNFKKAELDHFYPHIHCDINYPTKVIWVGCLNGSTLPDKCPYYLEHLMSGKDEFKIHSF